MARRDALDFSGRTVLVTGGARGVGRGISERFLEAGADVWTCGRHTPDSMPRAGGRNARFRAADVRDPDQVRELVEAVVRESGRLDVLVNNAGGSPAADAASASPRFSEKIVQLNLLAPLHCAQAANAVMQAQSEGGAIVNVASVSGVRPSPGTAAYGAAKAGLRSLTRSLAVEWAPRVRINAITVGMIRTERVELHYGDEEAVRRVEATVPLGRLGEPREVGDVCLFLASPLASYVSGASVLLHGGGEPPPFLAAVRGESG